jgi:hypothetical protein
MRGGRLAARIRDSEPWQRYLGPAWQWVRSPEVRRRRVRDQRVRRIQRATLPRAHDRAATRLIVFLTPGADPATGREPLLGGVMSICATCDETRALEPVHRSEVLLCTVPGGTPFLRHTVFPSDTDVYRLEHVLGYLTHLRSLTLHVPEYVAGNLISLLGRRQLRRLGQIERVHINVMNQNIDLLPRPEALDGLRRVSSLLTMTTAHERYCTEELSKRYRMPVHHLSVRTGAALYEPRPYADKEYLAVFSPDDPEKNDDVAHVLEGRFPQLETVVIEGMPYSEYRSILERAKWTFTFGEGLDFYFVESVFSGGIAFAVFNERFFTPEFESLDTVYSSFEELRANLANDIERLNDPPAYARYQRAQLAAVSSIYDVERFRARLESFYRGDYTWR